VEREAALLMRRLALEDLSKSVFQNFLILERERERERESERERERTLFATEI